MDTTAYEIGAVFFLAALFMMGTLTRGLIPVSIFKNARLVTFVTGGLLVGWMVYLWLPEISGLVDAGMTKCAVPSEAVPVETAKPVAAGPGVPAPPAIRSAGQPEATVKPTIRPTPVVKATIRPAPAVQIREAPSVQVAPAVATAPQPQQIPDIPAHTEAAPPVQPVASSGGVESVPTHREDGNRVTRAIKSVGHFLHIGHEKYEPPVVAPVPATPSDQGSAEGSR